jgi:hypothetical protein
LIPADQFTAMIISAPYRDQSKITMALSIRYEQFRACSELKDELPWLREVKAQLDVAAKALPRIAQGALRDLIERYVVPAIERIRKSSETEGQLANSVGADGSL